MGIIVNINKIKVIIIKSKKMTYNNFIYYNNYLEELPSYKYLGIKIHHIIALRKGQMKGSKLTMNLKTIVR